MISYDEFETLAIDRPSDGVLRIQLTGPDLHAVGPRAHAELADIWPVVARDASVRAVLIRGEGDRAFSAGGSFDLIEQMNGDLVDRNRVMREARDLVRNLIDLPQPLVAAINGPAAGAGLVTAMLADITVAGRKTKIVDGHVRLGVAAGDNAALTWPLFAGLPKAKYFLLLNEVLTGEEAERIGMVSLCVDDEQVQDKAMEIAERLAAGSVPSIQNTKHAINNWYRQNWSIFDASLGYEFYGFGQPDVTEGVASLREKRDPRFPAGRDNGETPGDAIGTDL
ncbi:enoyl-CoA hydratase/isomerase family protein [Gordonia sp. X0973]|uniref:enoyl-CoA hydratase/isomerase family protein n=1 Tax=Gordonia sp. X0973 TaxID=2742602 RepID=UPI000F53CF17|nr:enoyl-CoA hydratase/isomerase family protein [Gordonia sp. X0973]QKT08782.1 enoyl-CoA hydratase/isomerase family protein [Gordonia sp. X0973]